MRRVRKEFSHRFTKTEIKREKLAWRNNWRNLKEIKCDKWNIRLSRHTISFVYKRIHLIADHVETIVKNNHLNFSMEFNCETSGHWIMNFSALIHDDVLFNLLFSLINNIMTNICLCSAFHFDRGINTRLLPTSNISSRFDSLFCCDAHNLISKTPHLMKCSLLFSWQLNKRNFFHSSSNLIFFNEFQNKYV